MSNLLTTFSQVVAMKFISTFILALALSACGNESGTETASDDSRAV